MIDPTDEEIAHQLSGQYVKGPKQWRGKPLAPLSRGLWDVMRKVIVYDKDTALFHDVTLLRVLELAYAETDAGKLAARRALIKATDDNETFRAEISMIIDDLKGSEPEDTRRLADEIFEIVNQAEAVSLEKKSPVAEAAPTPMTTPSPSGPSRQKRAGRKTTSAGS